MLRFYARLALMLMLLFVVCGMGLIAFGSVQPMNPALRGFVEGCENAQSLCWYGIVADVTPLEIAQEILIREGYSFVQRDSWEADAFYPDTNRDTYRRDEGEGCNQIVFMYPSELTNPEITIHSLGDCRQIYVADSLALFGTPQWIYLSSNRGTIVLNHDIEVGFNGNFQFHSPVTSVRRVTGGSEWAFAWAGILPIWRYCQFEPVNPTCAPSS